jgi:hypothetical protein
MPRIAVIAAIAVVMTTAPVRSEDAAGVNSDPWEIAVHNAIERGAPDAAFAMVQHMHEVYNSTQGFGRRPANWWDKVSNVEHARHLPVPKLGHDYVFSTQRTPLSETRSSQGSSARPQPINAQGTPAQRARYDAVKAAVGDWPVTEADILSGYDPQLIARSYARFGHGAAEEPDRQQWMADQEQRAIANGINRSKPLMYPVRGR